MFFAMKGGSVLRLVLVKSKYDVRCNCTYDVYEVSARRKFRLCRVTFRHSCGSNGEMPFVYKKKKKRLTFEIIMYCVVRRSYVNLLMKFSDGVPVIFIKIIVLGKYDVS